MKMKPYCPTGGGGRLIQITIGKNKQIHQVIYKEYLYCNYERASKTKMFTSNIFFADSNQN
jgi:hypothetical protein